MFTPTHTTLAATLTTLIALLALARTAAYPTPPPPSLHALGLRGATADADVTQMFDVDPALLTCLKRSLASTETQVILIDNDQLSGAKARELSGRLARNRHVYAFGVGRRLSPTLVLTHSRRYHHVSCQKTKDAADATMLLLAMRLWCLYAGLHRGAWARLGLCVVSRDRVFEQLRASFALCSMDVVLEAS